MTPMPQSPSSSSSSEAERDDLLSNSDMARIYRRVTGGNRFDTSTLQLMREVEHAVLARATPPGLPIDFKQASESQRVYLVATGETHEGQETYTRHDVRPPLCDAETLYTHPAPKQASEQGEMEAEEDAWVIDRLSKLLAGVAIALKGEERPRHRHSFHDLPDVAQVMKLELDLYRATFPNGVPESATAGVSDCGISDEQLWSAYLTILNWVEYVGKEEAIAKARAALSPSPHPEEGALLLGGDEGGKKGGA